MVGEKKTHCILIHKPIHTGQTDSDAELPVCETRLACDVRK